MTVINVYTKKSVPFKVLSNGEIQICSPDPVDNEDTCEVVNGNIFYEHSQDYGKVPERV